MRQWIRELRPHRHLLTDESIAATQDEPRRLDVTDLHSTVPRFTNSYATVFAAKTLRGFGVLIKCPSRRTRRQHHPSAARWATAANLLASTTSLDSLLDSSNIKTTWTKANANQTYFAS